MTEYFFESDYIQAEKQRKRVILLYFVFLALFLTFSVGMVLWYCTLPYKSSTIVWVKVIHYTVSALFVVFSFIYLGIAYRRALRYARLCRTLLTGIREDNEAEFVEHNPTPQDKDGVDCTALIFLEWNKFKHEYYERKVLLLREKPVPEIPSKARVKFVTQGNVLISYEIVSLFDDVDDGEGPNNT